MTIAHEQPQDGDGSADCRQIAVELRDALGVRFVAAYRFGSTFGRGPKASRARVLLLIDRIDRAVLDAISPLAHAAKSRQVQLRVDTAEALLASADAFPVMTLELIATRELLAGGSDPLDELAVDAARLRLRVEQNLRVIHRELVQTYLEVGDRLQPLASELRRAARKLLYLLEGALIAADAALPSTPVQPGALVDALAALVGDEDLAVWRKLLSFASYDEIIDRDELADFFSEVLAALDKLVGIIDAL
ncbi:MAG: hypothetical protein KC503_24815 [Myxococcales bacterium]|nr:hypothetical protein [Myxococcales bacterium]